MPACRSRPTRCRRRQRSQLPQLSLHSQSVHSEANDSLRLAHSLAPQLKLCSLLSATTEFTNCSTHAETESAPNIARLLSAETERPPKVPICPHSAPKPKPKFGRPLSDTVTRATNLAFSTSRRLVATSDFFRAVKLDYSGFYPNGVAKLELHVWRYVNI